MATLTLRKNKSSPLTFLEMDDNWEYLNERINTISVRGITPASATSLGGIMVGDGLSITNLGLLSLNVGAGLSVDPNGVLINSGVTKIVAGTNMTISPTTGVGQVTISTTATSDQRLKTDIKPSDLGLEFINRLNPVSYTLITNNTGPEVGLIAQEVKQILDSMNIHEFGGWMLSDASNPDSTQLLNYYQFIAPLIKAVQELTARVEYLEQQLNNN